MTASLKMQEKEERGRKVRGNEQNQVQLPALHQELSQTQVHSLGQTSPQETWVQVDLQYNAQHAGSTHTGVELVHTTISALHAITIHMQHTCVGHQDLVLQSASTVVTLGTDQPNVTTNLGTTGSSRE